MGYHLNAIVTLLTETKTDKPEENKCHCVDKSDCHKSIFSSGSCNKCEDGWKGNSCSEFV